MKAVIAPDSFKESLPAAAAAAAIEAGFRMVFPHWNYACMPLADGGEGTVDAVVAATGGRRISRTVRGPLGAPLQARFGLTGDGRTAIIELAAAAGLALLPRDRRDPMRAGTHGVGELVAAALDLGVRRFVIGLGGSASSDGGAGMLQALGARLLDAGGQPIAPGGAGLADLARIDVSDLDARLAGCEIEVACDVDNPLVGAEGAAAVFGPQKGATAAMVRQLDDNLRHYARCIERDLGREVARLSGAGAAGGAGAGLVALLNARLRPGAGIVFAVVGLEAALRDADLVVTGEGRIDGQSMRGKVPAAVAAIARRHGKPVIALAGNLGEDAGLLLRHGVAAMFAVLPRPMSLDEALAGARANLRRTARNVAMALAIGQGLAPERDGRPERD